MITRQAAFLPHCLQMSKFFSMFQLGSDTVLVKDKLWRIRCLIFYCWLNMANVKLLFEVILYKFISLQGRYPENIVCAMRCYCTVSLIWKKVCVGKSLSVFIEVKIQHISFLSQWQKVNKGQNVSSKGQRANFLLLLNPSIQPKHIFVVILYRWQKANTEFEKTDKRHESWIRKI